MPNMVICQMLFNADGKIKKYVDASDILGCDNCLLATFWLDTPSGDLRTEDSALDILREFADVRLSIYETSIASEPTV